MPEYHDTDCNDAPQDSRARNHVRIAPRLFLSQVIVLGGFIDLTASLVVTSQTDAREEAK